MAYEVKTTVQIDADRLADLMCCALEGGSTYWCEKFEPDDYPAPAKWGHEAVAFGADFTIWYDEEFVKSVKNGEDEIQKALQLMADEHPFHFNNFVNENEDAETGDVFFQLLCFGELVYG